MDAATQARLMAQWEAQNKPQTSIADDTKQKALLDRWNKREKYLAETGGFGGGMQRFGDALMHGLTKETAMGLAQLTGQADAKAVDKMRADAAHLTASPQGKLGNIVGSTVAPAVVGGGVGTGLKTISALKNMNATRNALGGAASGMVMPVGSDESRTLNTALGFAGAALPSVLKKAVTQPIRPSEAAQKLVDVGIYPTPGQAKGGALNSLESAATSMPIVGPFVSTARAKPFQEYVKYRQGQFGYTGDKTGRLATEEMGNIADENYSKVLPKLQLEVTPELRAQYLRNVQLLPPQQQNSMRKLIEFELDPKTAKSSAGILGGEETNTWQSLLRKEGQHFGKSPDTYQQKLGAAFTKSREDTIDAINNQGLVSPDVAQEFADARKYYGGMKNLMELGTTGTAAKRGGMFTPAEDLKWMKGKYGDNAFGRNQVPDQDVAQAGVDVLGGVPDSGTAGRLAMLSFMKDPNISWTEGLLGGTLAAASPQPVRKALVGGYNWQKSLAEKLRAADNPWLTSPSVTGLNVWSQDQNN
jgi:hypothetical protein